MTPRHPKPPRIRSLVEMLPIALLVKGREFAEPLTVPTPPAILRARESVVYMSTPGRFSRAKIPYPPCTTEQLEWSAGRRRELRDLMEAANGLRLTSIRTSRNPNPFA